MAGQLSPISPTQPKICSTQMTPTKRPKNTLQSEAMLVQGLTSRNMPHNWVFRLVRCKDSKREA
jgi:hypothetical protein